jgi:hypothetical protein
LSPEQCLAARERLHWSRDKLSRAADVPLWFLVAFEDGKETPAFLAGYEVDLRNILESVGIGFPFEIVNGLSAPAGITYSPRDKSETN